MKTVKCIESSSILCISKANTYEVHGLSNHSYVIKNDKGNLIVAYRDRFIEQPEPEQSEPVKGKTAEEIFKPFLFSDQHESIEKEYPGIHAEIYKAMQVHSSQQVNSVLQECIDEIEAKLKDGIKAIYTEEVWKILKKYMK